MRRDRAALLAKKRLAVALSALKRGRDARAAMKRMHTAARAIQRSWDGYVYRQVKAIKTAAKQLLCQMVRASVIAAGYS